jgi:transposase
MAIACHVGGPPLPTRRSQPPRQDTRPCVHPHAAGLDIGSEEIWAGVPEDRDTLPVRAFGTCTPDRLALADWLVSCRIATVAMASTGVSGIPVYAMLAARGFNVDLGHAHHLKQVPGRTSENKDGQWSQSWQTCGLLSASCRPEAELCALRAYWRHRARWLAYRAAHIQHRQKARHQMNGPLSQGLTDMTGVTGWALIRAIVEGERDPVHLARLREPRCANSPADLAQALTGPSQPEQVFALKQALALYEAYTEQVRACDAAIEPRCRAMKPVGPDVPPPLNRAHTHRTHQKNAPADDARGLLYQLTGGD